MSCQCLVISCSSIHSFLLLWKIYGQLCDEWDESTKKVLLNHLTNHVFYRLNETNNRLSEWKSRSRKYKKSNDEQKMGKRTNRSTTQKQTVVSEDEAEQNTGKYAQSKIQHINQPRERETEWINKWDVYRAIKSSHVLQFTLWINYCLVKQETMCVRVVVNLCMDRNVCELI